MLLTGLHIPVESIYLTAARRIEYGLLSDNPSLFFDSSRTTLILTSNPEYGMGIWRSFPDVSQEVIKAGGPDKIWYTADGWLDYVVEANLMGGYASNGWFGPYDNITRGRVATILATALNAQRTRP